LSSFPREEAAAIVNYLEYKREGASTAFEEEAIEEALRSFWRERAQTAPSAESLARHLAEEAEYFDAIRDRKGEGGPPEER